MAALLPIQTELRAALMSQSTLRASRRIATVQVSVDCGCGPAAVQSTTFNIKAPTVVTDEIDNAEVCAGETDSVVFQVAATGAGTLSYAWTLDGNPATDADGDKTKLTVDASALSVGSHPVNVVVTGDCGTDSSAANLVVNSNPTCDCVDLASMRYSCKTHRLGRLCSVFLEWAHVPSANQGWNCGLDKDCLLVDKTGVYTVTSENATVAGSQTAQLCFTIDITCSGAPAGVPVKAPPSKPTARGSLLSKLVSAMLWAL